MTHPNQPLTRVLVTVWQYPTEWTMVQASVALLDHLSDGGPAGIFGLSSTGPTYFLALLTLDEDLARQAVNGPTGIGKRCMLPEEDIAPYAVMFLDDVAAGRYGAAYAASEREVGRNAPCPCGSGQKFKRCHGDAPLA